MGVVSTNANSRGVDLTTLAITAVASGAAAYACSKIWAPGTLPSAAITPVLVALIKEALARPAKVVSQAVPVRGVVRSSGAGSDEPARRRPPPDEDPTRVAEAPITTYTTRRSPISRRWRLAIVTGLLGFVLCVLVLTVPELVAGGSASGGGRQTTLFGGESKKEKRERTETTTAPTRTVTPPQRTVTVPPPAKTVPAPGTTKPPPAGRTPAPAPTPPAQPPPVQP